MRGLLLLLPLCLLSAQGPEGIYLGELQGVPRQLRLGLEITQGASGKFKAELTSIDQAYAKLAAGAVEWDGKKLSFAIAAINASFSGTMSDDGTAIAGKFTQGAALDLVLKKVASFPRPPRPQEPKPPFPYESQDLNFPGGADSVRLAGNLTKPKGSGKFPAVVLVSGSGPQNRDEEIALHKPFLLWADTLTRAGFAVLRYDDRGTEKPTGTFSGSTTEDFAKDAAAALSYLRGRPDIDPRRIVVMGHSEGALIAPMVAAADSGIAGIVLLAAPAVSGEAVFRKQLPALNEAAGMSQEQAAQYAAQQLAAIEKRRVSDPCLNFFWSHDPAPVLAKVKCPVLALNGELDRNVDAGQNLTVVQAIFAEHNPKLLTAKSFPQLNHLFQTAKTGSPQEYATIEETVAPVVLETVTAWLKSTLSTPPVP